MRNHHDRYSNIRQGVLFLPIRGDAPPSRARSLKIRLRISFVALSCQLPGRRGCFTG